MHTTYKKCKKQRKQTNDTFWSIWLNPVFIRLLRHEKDRG